MSHIVIIGCGFGGMAAAKALRSANVTITLIDRSNHHLFQPLLYQVATAGLSAPAIAAPIRHIFARQRNLTTLLAAVTAIDPHQRQVVLEIEGHPEIFVIGDLAAATSGGKAVPGVSPVAKQMGKTAAVNILCRIKNELTKVFRYHDYGSLATIGRKAAVAMVGKVKFSGFLAWLFLLVVHVYFLIGFRNRLVVLSDWAWAYMTFQRNARSVIAKEAGEQARKAKAV